MRYSSSFHLSWNWNWLISFMLLGGDFLFQFLNKYVLCLIAFLRVKFATFIIHNSLRCAQCFSRLRLWFRRFYFHDDVVCRWISADANKFHDNKICYYLILLSTHTRSHISNSFFQRCVWSGHLQSFLWNICVCAARVILFVL